MRGANGGGDSVKGIPALQEYDFEQSGNSDGTSKRCLDAATQSVLGTGNFHRAYAHSGDDGRCVATCHCLHPVFEHRSFRISLAQRQSTTDWRPGPRSRRPRTIIGRSASATLITRQTKTHGDAFFRRGLCGSHARTLCSFEPAEDVRRAPLLAMLSDTDVPMLRRWRSLWGNGISMPASSIALATATVTSLWS